jgi:hypothetical protein
VFVIADPMFMSPAATHSLRLYRVRLGSRPVGRRVPPLLFEFSRWLAKQPDGCIGGFDLEASAIPSVPTRAWLNQHVWCFARIHDGSRLALFDTEDPTPVEIEVSTTGSTPACSM